MPQQFLGFVARFVLLCNQLLHSHPRFIDNREVCAAVQERGEQFQLILGTAKDTDWCFYKIKLIRLQRNPLKTGISSIISLLIKFMYPPLVLNSQHLLLSYKKVLDTSKSTTQANSRRYHFSSPLSSLFIPPSLFFRFTSAPKHKSTSSKFASLFPFWHNALRSGEFPFASWTSMFAP